MSNKGHRGTRAFINRDELEECFKKAIEVNAKYVYVVTKKDDMLWHDTIIIPYMIFENRLNSYKEKFNRNLKSDDSEKIIDFGFCLSLDDLKKEIDEIYDI